jgi:hypothetical protein
VAFLPGGLPVPDDLVQSGVPNVTQVDTWLQANFDSPLLVRPADATVGARSSSTASDIYALAVTAAQPAGTVNSPAWQRVAGEIQTAQTEYGQPGGDKPIVCSPDDWELPGNQSYWASFDSSVATSTTTTTSAGPAPNPPWRVNPVLWKLRVLDSEIQLPEREAPIFNQLGPLPVERKPMLSESLTGTIRDGIPTAAPTVVARIGSFPVQDLRTLPVNLDYTTVLSQAPAVQNVTATTSSSLVVQLEHSCVSLRRAFGGQSWWDGVFLADRGWYVPGMPSGALVAAAPSPTARPDETTPDQQVFAVPVGLIVVRNLSVHGEWSAEAAQALSSSSASIGPLTLFGASSASSASGTSTYSRPGMQVVALLCATLPMLPPIDDPSMAPASTASSGASMGLPGPRSPANASLACGNSA